MDNARKLKFSSYVHLPSINKNVSISLRLSDYVHVGEVIIFVHGCYISGLEHIRMLILSNYVLLACKKTIYEYDHTWVL